MFYMIAFILNSYYDKIFNIPIIFMISNDNWRQAEAWFMLFVGAIEANGFAQGALRRVTQWVAVDRKPKLLEREADTLPLS